MSDVKGRMVIPSMFNFLMIGTLLTPAATAYHSVLGLWFGIATGLAALATLAFSYTLTIRIPTPEEIKELLDDERD